MTKTIVVEIALMLILSTDLTPQAWIFVGLCLAGVFAIVAWLFGCAALKWKQVIRRRRDS